MVAFFPCLPHLSRCCCFSVLCKFRRALFPQNPIEHCYYKGRVRRFDGESLVAISTCDGLRSVAAVSADAVQSGVPCFLCRKVSPFMWKETGNPSDAHQTFDQHNNTSRVPECGTLCQERKWLTLCQRCGSLENEQHKSQMYCFDFRGVIHLRNESFVIQPLTMIHDGNYVSSRWNPRQCHHVLPQACL